MYCSDFNLYHNFEKNKQTNKSFSVSQGGYAEGFFDPVILSMSPPSIFREQFSISPFFFPFPLSLLTHRKQAFSPRYKNQALVGNIYLILIPVVSCEKNRMSKMAAEILADTKQQLKRGEREETQRSLQYHLKPASKEKRP